MRAIVVRAFGGPEVLRLEEVPSPTPGEGQVRVRLSAAGVNPVETYIRSGAYARKPALPYTPGTDGAGTVEAIGPGTTGFQPGDRVFVAALLAPRHTGTYAEAIAVDAGFVHPLPAHVTFAQGAALGVPYCTAYRALFQRAALRAGETVLVHGASGGVGLACLQLARAAGARVIGSAGTAVGRRLVVANGAHHALDHSAAGYLDEVVSLTGGRGADVIIEMLANANLERDFAALALYGRIVVVGSRGTIEFSPRLIMAREAAVLGMTLWNTPAADATATTAGIAAALEAGVVKPVVAMELPLAEAPRAHVEVLAPGARGKIVLVP